MSTKKEKNEELEFTWDYDRDNEMLINGMKARAKEEGFNQGKKEQQMEMAKNLIKIDLPIDKIVEVTNLSKIQIQKLM